MAIFIIVISFYFLIPALILGLANHYYKRKATSQKPTAKRLGPLAASVVMTTLAALTSTAQTMPNFTPEIHGTIRAKYEYEPQIEKGRFEIRNARISVEGRVLPIVSYKAEIDLSDEGAIKMLDAYIRLQPRKPLRLTFGQMRVPFTIDAHRSPHLQYFANRSFIAKHVGNVRDVGAAVAWSIPVAKVPVTLEGGIFNGSGLTGQKNYWTNNYCFSFKAQTMICNHVNLTLSTQKARVGDTDVYMYDAGAYYQSERWHVEGEYLRKHYRRDASKPVNSYNIFAAYRLPMQRDLRGISFLARYDYMSDHSNGTRNDDGRLKITDPERHRLTGGLTLHLGTSKLQADVRLNYEQYFYRRDTPIGISDHNKFVAEFVCHF